MLVALLGTIVLGGIIWAAVFFTTKPDIVKIAVGPDGSVDAKFVQVLSDQLKKDNSKIHFQVVPTSGAKGSAQAMTDHQADLAILPSSVGELAELAGDRNPASECDGFHRSGAWCHHIKEGQGKSGEDRKDIAVVGPSRRHRHRQRGEQWSA